MFALTLRSTRSIAPLKYVFRTSTNLRIMNDEYTDEPQYPEIMDLSREAKKLRREHKWYEKVKEVKTVEEKLIKINIPKFFGWRCMMTYEDFLPYDPMPYIQHITRTHFIQQDSLPEHYSVYQPVAETVIAEIRDEIQNSLIFENNIQRNFTPIKRENWQNRDARGDEQRDDEKTFHIVTRLNRIILNSLSRKCQHLSSVQVDLKPRHESFWFAGGMTPTYHMIKSRKGNAKCRRIPDTKEVINAPIDRPIQFLGKPLLSLRSSLPLEPLLPYTDAENPSYSVPKWTYSPEVAGYMHEFRHGTNIPGFWVGDPDEFGFMNIRGRGHLLSRPKAFGEEDNIEALHSQAMVSSFGWLLSLACYQGFSPLNDVTYPTVAQTVITNGQYWSFYVYQLNTTSVHRKFIDENPKRNVCFGTRPLKLYESIEDGKVVGFNDDVLKILLQLYANEPKTRADTEMKPYLGETEKVIADYDDPEKRIWLESRYKRLLSNRPRHHLLPEIYHWEKIYKIDHDTRPMDAKKKPWELGLNQWKRKLSKDCPVYIPKALRPGGKKNKDKFAKTYYP